MRATAMVLGLIAFGCEQQFAGEAVGTFEVVGQLQENTCGPQLLPVLSPISFVVELRRDQAEAYWRRPSGPAVTGSVQKDAYQFQFSAPFRLAPTLGEPLDPAACAVRQVESIAFTVGDAVAADGGVTADAGAPDASGSCESTVGCATLEGTSSIDLTNALGVTCDLVVEGGTVALPLPCRATYALDGSQTAAL